MKSHKDFIQKRFSQKANVYDEFACVQKEMAHQLIHQLDNLPQIPETILEIGCGTGYLTKLMLERFPQARYTAVDIAWGMVDEAKKRFSPESARCDILLADVEEWAPRQTEQSYDLIVSNACFQWLTESVATFTHLYRLLRKRGMLCFTTFGPHTFYELHEAFAITYKKLGKPVKRHGLSFGSPNDWKQIIEQVGFCNISICSRDQVEYHPCVRDFLMSVKGIGANMEQADDSTGMGRPRFFLQMMQNYDSLFRTDRGIPATYEVIVASGAGSLSETPLIVQSDR